MYSFVILLPLILSIVNGFNISTQGRIVGGKIVDIQMYPYQVSVQFNGRHICGGSIIAPDTILTAAHCTYESQASEMSIRSGSNSAHQGGTLHQVSRIEQHPNFNKKTISNDVSKLIITPPITYSENSQPIELALERPADNSLVVITGWGKRRESEGLSLAATRHLRAVIVPIVNQEACAQKYIKKYKVTDVMICAAERGKDSCKGDSGGPLVDMTTGEQVGVSSWGIGCARSNFPGVYASVPDLLDFIDW